MSVADSNATWSLCQTLLVKYNVNVKVLETSQFHHLQVSTLFLEKASILLLTLVEIGGSPSYHVT